MQSSILFLLLNCLFCGAIWTQALAGSSNFSGPKVLIMGDSLSAAYNISMEQSWPVLFQQKLQSISPESSLINASISGETSGGGAERLEALLNQHHPTHLILELGGNDGLRGYKFNQTRQHLTSMITLAQQRGIAVLMIGVRLPPNLGPLYNQRFQQVYEHLSEQFSITYLARFLEGIAADRPEYMQADGIHPTALAQPLLAEKVFNLFHSSYIKPGI